MNSSASTSLPLLSPGIPQLSPAFSLPVPTSRIPKGRLTSRQEPANEPNRALQIALHKNSTQSLRTGCQISNLLPFPNARCQEVSSSDQQNMAVSNYQRDTFTSRYLHNAIRAHKRTYELRTLVTKTSLKNITHYIDIRSIKNFSKDQCYSKQRQNAESCNQAMLNTEIHRLAPTISLLQ